MTPPLDAPDQAYTAASLALADARADVGDGTVVTALRPAIAAGVAVTAAAPHIRRHTLEQLAARQARSGATRWAALAAASGSAVLPSIAVYAALVGGWWVAVLCAASWAGFLVGVCGLLRADHRARQDTLNELEALEARHAAAQQQVRPVDPG